MAGSPYVLDAKKYRPEDFERVAGEPSDPDPASWGMQPDGTFLPPASTPSVPRDVFVDWPGQLTYRDPETYAYIPASLERYPAQRGVARLMEEAGLVKTRYANGLLGTMGFNVGEAP